MPDGIPSPNPDFPQNIKNVTGNSNVKIQNKNLFIAQKIVDDSNNNSTWLTEDGYIRYATGGNRMKIIPPIIKENTAYTIKFIIKSGTTSQNGIVFRAFYTDGTNAQIYVTIRTDTAEFIAIASTNSTKTLLRIESEYTHSQPAFVKIDGSMILEGSYTEQTIPSYVPHEEQNLPFTFEEGQRLMQGGSLQDDGIHQKRKQVILDGTETWGNAYSTTDTFSCTINLGTNVKLVNDIPLGYLSNYFKAYPAGAWSSNIQRLVQMNDKTFRFGIYMTELNEVSINGFKAWLAQQYNNGTPVTVEYELETEETIPYNSTQQVEYNAIKEAHTYKDITYISGESDELPPELEIQYWKERGAEQ